MPGLPRGQHPHGGAVLLVVSLDRVDHRPAPIRVNLTSYDPLAPAVGDSYLQLSVNSSASFAVEESSSLIRISDIAIKYQVIKSKMMIWNQSKRWYFHLYLSSTAFVRPTMSLYTGSTSLFFLNLNFSFQLETWTYILLFFRIRCILLFLWSRHFIQNFNKH